tara:strand:+ start:5406 stop:6704 length:1299 start_codon:yes stop_codon:yes gene_type:complete
MFKRLCFAALLVVGVFAGAAYAATATTEVSARGYGETPQQALAEALVAAVRQAGGVTLSVNPDFRRQVANWAIQRDGDASTWIGSSTSVAEPRLPTLGSLESYQVTAMQQVDDALWRADVKARVLSVKALGPARSHLPAVVVAPFQSRAASYQLGKVRIEAAEARRRLQADLVEAFAQSGRFRVLDRANLAVRDEELAILAEGSTEPAELVRLGKSKGADLVLVGTIEDFDIGDGEREFYGAKFQGYEPRIRVRYRLIDVASGEILSADLFDWQRSEASVREIARQQNIDEWNHPERIGDVIYPQIARAIAGTATDVLYPVRVLKVAGDTVYLSQGQGRLEQGQELVVRRPGETLKDPDTGLDIRLESPAPATLEVTEVRPDYGLARITAGEGSPQAGDPVRQPDNRSSARPAAAGHPMTPGSSEAPIRWND